MATPTPAQTAALIELHDSPTGSTLPGVRRNTIDAMRLSQWVTRGAPGNWHITQDGSDALSRTRDGRAYLDTVWSAAHTGYARTHGPVTPHQLRALIDRYRTMMDSAAQLDDAVHHRSCDSLRARAMFDLARIATAVNRQIWMHPDAILEAAEDHVEDTLPGVALYDEVLPDAERATCIHDGRPIARRVRDGVTGKWFHIDEYGGLGCFADATWPQVATPLPDGDQGDTRVAVAQACSAVRPHTPHPWGDDPAQRFLCAGAGTGRTVAPGSGCQRPVKAAAAALLIS